MKISLKSTGITAYVLLKKNEEQVWCECRYDVAMGDMVEVDFAPGLYEIIKIENECNKTISGKVVKCFVEFKPEPLNYTNKVYCTIRVWKNNVVAYLKCGYKAFKGDVVFYKNTSTNDYYIVDEVYDLVSNDADLKHVTLAYRPKGSGFEKIYQTPNCPRIQPHLYTFRGKTNFYGYEELVNNLEKQYFIDDSIESNKNTTLRIGDDYPFEYTSSGKINALINKARCNDVESINSLINMYSEDTSKLGVAKLQYWKKRLNKL